MYQGVLKKKDIRIEIKMPNSYHFFGCNGLCNGLLNGICNQWWVSKLWNHFTLPKCYGNDAEAETPTLWPPHVKSWLTGKESDVGRDWGQEEKGTIEDEMAGWNHWLDGRESEWTPGVGAGQGGLVCCDSWGHKEWDTTERLHWTELKCYGRKLNGCYQKYSQANKN